MDPRPCSPDDLGPPGTTDDTTSTNLQHVLIKWTGSKRRQAGQIVAKFPRQIATYYEPFLGGGSVLYELLGSDIEVGRFEVQRPLRAPDRTLAGRQGRPQRAGRRIRQELAVASGLWCRLLP